MRQIKVLIVDDEAPFTRLLKAALENTGNYQVWEENECLHALEQAKELKPDLILMDIMMPATTGAYLALRMREDPCLLDTPIVYLTAVVPKENPTTAHRDLGGFPFIAKPVGLQELIDCIDENLPAEKRIA